MKKIMYSAFVLLLVLSAAGCSGAPAGKIYGRGDENIAVSVGDTFTIALEENPSTGYEWAADISDKNIVSLESEVYEPKSVDPGIVGAGGVKALTFKGLEKGGAVITLVYERSFEKDSAIETLVYNVTVK